MARAFQPVLAEAKACGYRNIQSRTGPIIPEKLSPRQ